MNLPNLQTQERIAEMLEIIANKEDAKVTDPTNSPGPKVLVAGDRENGFYGFVQPWEFGHIEGNPEGQTEFNGQNLAIAIGLTQGTSQFSNTPWLKFSRNGDILLVPMKGIRYSTSWNAIYDQGAIYGDGTVGINPPNGRAGNNLSVDGASNSFLVDPRSAGEGFLRGSAEIASVGDTIVARNFSNNANNGEFTVRSITDTAISVDGSLVSEPNSNPKASLYNKNDAVTQNRKVVSGGNEYKVRLLQGAAQDPLDSYRDSDRDMVGPNSEWNSLILPLHENAKTGSWAYSAYAGDVEYWGLDLTDKDLHTHNRYGNGAYSWTQETSDDVSWARVIRGYGGASYSFYDSSWSTRLIRVWRPALLLSGS